MATLGIDKTGEINLNEDPSPLEAPTATNSVINSLGGAYNIKQITALAEQMLPKDKPFDPALASLLYFTKMGELASKPGATLFGSVAGAGVAPAQYLLQKEKEKAEREKDIAKTTLTLAGTLGKAKTSKLYNYSKDVVENGQVIKKAGEPIRLTELEIQSLPPAEQALLIPYKAPGAGTKQERNRDAIIRIAPRIADGTASKEEIQQYTINYMDLLSPKTSTEQTADGKTITRKEPGIDLTVIKGLPVPKNFDPSKILDEKAREFGPLGTNATFSQRMLYNEGIVREVLEGGYELNIQDVTADNFGGAWLGTTLQTPQGQRFYSSSRNFIAAVLRKESGAAISDGEYINGLKQYFPQLGDTPQVMEDKQALREAAIAGMVRESGDAFKSIYPDAVQFLKTKSEGKEFDILNPRGYSAYALGKVRQGKALYFKSTLESMTIDDLKKMFGSGGNRYTDPQLEMLDAEIKRKQEELAK